MLDLPNAVLFFCTLNQIRSPMAEGILKHYHGQQIYVDSVGIHEGEIDGFMIEAMADIGIDVSLHKPKTFQELQDTSYDLVITLSPEAQHSALELTRWMSCEVEYWPTFNPSVVTGSRERRLDGYRQVRNELVGKIKNKFPLVPTG
ncbi:MAG: low molecular weight phosphatase family protein [Rhodospirillales bacterium]|nr:low molecular weight phosphatase family protein [Rhodospirillales bacterium]